MSASLCQALPAGESHPVLGPPLANSFEAASGAAAGAAEYISWSHGSRSSLPDVVDDADDHAGALLIA